MAVPVLLATSIDDHYCRTSHFFEKIADKKVPVYGQKHIPPSWITFKQNFKPIRKEETVYVNLTSRFTIRKFCENGKWNPTVKLCDCNRNYGGKFCDKDCRRGECVEQPLDYREDEADKKAIREHLQPNKLKLEEAPNKDTSLPKRDDFALTFDHQLPYQNRTLIGILFAVTSIVLYLLGVAMIFESAKRK
ncbi:uncharacterized protein LOC119651614 [Hermetia illucens]|uniref:uncharacterized protein LOC119651614 n=1 Tax=Hermetia illucens TaxID=343691 RepID=UPI0018CC14BD|nr:uncharacterized protein LOC119651614 [Hermetia illucens]